MGRFNLSIHEGLHFKVGRFNDQKWEKRGSASDYIYDVAYLKISAIIKTEIADVACRLPRNFIVDRKYRLPSGRRYFCYLIEMMMATKVPNAIIRDNASYTLIVSPPLLEKWETDHRTISERYYSTLENAKQVFCKAAV